MLGGGRGNTGSFPRARGLSPPLQGAPLACGRVTLRYLVTVAVVGDPTHFVFMQVEMSPQERWGPGPPARAVGQRQLCARSSCRRPRLRPGDIKDWGQRAGDPFLHLLMPAPQGGRKMRAVVAQRGGEPRRYVIPVMGCRPRRGCVRNTDRFVPPVLEAEMFIHL